MREVDPFALARAQLREDARRTAWMPVLFERKRERMSANPLAFLRGTAPLYYALLRERRFRGPAGQGWIAGDLHVENFGAYRPNPAPEHGHHPAPEAVFDLNDFDDAVDGPWWLDVLRLATSMLLGARSAGAEGASAMELAWRLLSAYPPRALKGAALPRVPQAVSRLIAAAGNRSRKELLDDRTSVVRGGRRFVRGGRYLPAPRAAARAVPAALDRYVKSLPPGQRPSPEHFEIEDVALRVAGTGSLGCLRLAVLTSGKGGRDGAWILDIKEEGSPSAAIFMRLRRQVPAQRVLAGLSACPAHPPRFAGTTRLLGRSMLVRKLTPQEDKLDLASLEARDWPEVASYLGALAGAAHRRGATRPARGGWSSSELEQLLEEASWLAGMHESVYLAYCRLANG